jgi:glycosyltransferase involved in cell wall biosynthesis
MGCYAEAIRTRLAKTAPEPLLGAKDGWVVISDSDWEPDLIRSLFPSCPRLLILSGAEKRRNSGCVRYGQVLSGIPRLSPAAIQELTAGYSAAILLDGRSLVSGRLLLELLRLGVRRVAYRDPLRWVIKPTRWVIAKKPLARMERRLVTTRIGSWYRVLVSRAHERENLLLRHRNVLLSEDESKLPIRLTSASERSRRKPGDPIKVVQYIAQLNSGGAERQLANLSVALHKGVHPVRVFTTYPLTNEDAHYLDLLEDAGVPIRPAGMSPSKAVDAVINRLDLHPKLIRSIPDAIRTPVLDLVGELIADPPDILHCWLDQPNLIGGIAGTLAGIPLILLSTRNLNPSHFPDSYQAWLDPWYRYLIQIPQVHLLSNSHAGADDYAKWMRIEPRRIHVIPNGVDTKEMGKVPSRSIRKFRKEIDLQRDQPLVAGVFRMAIEKQPLLFLDVAERVLKEIPNLKVVIAGVGPMRNKVADEIRSRGLGESIHLLGQRRDVRVILAAADALLLTSKAEGTPNVVLEAQLLGCPAVATDVGGTSEVLEDKRTGFLRAPDDPAGLAQDLIALLRNSETRHAMGQAGRSLVVDQFSMDRIFELTEKFYHGLLNNLALESKITQIAPAGNIKEAE